MVAHSLCEMTGHPLAGTKLTPLGHIYRASLLSNGAPRVERAPGWRVCRAGDVALEDRPRSDCLDFRIGHGYGRQECLCVRVLGIVVEVVDDGQQAIDYLTGCDGDFPDAERPMLVVLDSNLPHKDGFDVLAEIRADSILRTIPVIMLLGVAEGEDVDRAYELGANTCIEKPITVEEYRQLFETIGSYWSRASR